MHRFIANVAALLGAIILILAFALDAEAKVGPQNMTCEVRTHEVVIPNLQIEPGSSETNAAIAGEHGVIMKGELYAGSAAHTQVAQTSSVGVFAYPAAVRALTFDHSGNTTASITCTSATIKGRDQFGNYVQETLTSIDETGVVSTRVYEKILSVAFAGCLGATATDDEVGVVMTQRIGIQRKLWHSDQILAVCSETDGGGQGLICADGSDLDTGTEYNLTYGWIDFGYLAGGSGYFGSQIAADEGGYTVTVRTRNPVHECK